MSDTANPYEPLQQQIERAEKLFKALKPIYPTWIIGSELGFKLGFAKHNNAWRIMFIADHHAADSRIPLSDAAVAFRIANADRLPALHEAIVNAKSAACTDMLLAARRLEKSLDAIEAGNVDSPQIEYLSQADPVK